MHVAEHLRKKIDIKYFMAGYLACLAVVGIVRSGGEPFGVNSPWSFKALLVIPVYVVLDLLWTYQRERLWYVPLSSVISALILVLVALPALPLSLVVLLPVIAVPAKRLGRFGRRRHLFNPAALALVAVSLFTPVVSWWGVAWGLPALITVSVLGLFILWRQERWHVVIPFFASHFVFLSLFFLYSGIEPSRLFAFLKPQLFEGTLVFFATVMLIEPITSNFPGRRARMIYGALVGFFAVVVGVLAGTLPQLSPLDPLLTGLILGNLVASLIFLPKRKPEVAGELSAISGTRCLLS
ncbi:MAG: hypothetical protein U1A16_03950 [Patescibacteria group bacterium]|nr:hypothetical protein [Patescibacteria group bacterium]